MSENAKKSSIFKVVVIALVVLIAAVIALPFIIDVNQFRPQIESKLSNALGRQVKAGNLKLSLLSGSVEVSDLSISDDPSFSRSPFVTTKSLQVGVELKPLILSKAVRITGISLQNPAITLIRSASGRWNFSNLGSGESSAESKRSTGFSGSDIAIKELKITGGKVTMVRSGAGAKASVYDNVEATISNLSFASAFPFTVTASLPGSGSFKLEGSAGPINPTDMLLTPVSAQLTVKHFDLIASGFVSPGSGLAGLFDFGGTVTSDGRLVQSKGRASAEQLQVMKSGSRAGKPISLQYALRHNLERQTGILDDATIGYGKAVAHLNGSYILEGNDVAMHMRLRGTDMPVQDLTALLPAFGITLPKGASLQGGGLTVDLTTEGPIEKMVIAGATDISKTRLAGFDLAGKMATVAKLAGLKPNAETEIEKFASKLRMSPEGIQVSALQLIVPALGELAGDGTIGPDQSLDFKMKALLKPAGGVAAGLAQLTKGSGLNVPFFVRGTASDPKFVPDVKNAAKGILSSVISGQSSKEGQSDTGKALGDALRGLFKKK
jgi:AsmA protein